MRSAEGGTAQEHGECGSSGEPDNAGRWVMAAGGEHEGHELTDEGHTTPDGGGRRPQHAHAGAAWEVMAAGLVYSPVRRADEVARVRVRVEEARVQQLLQVADDAQLHQLAHVVARRLRQLLPVQPRGGQHAPACVLRHRLGHHDLHARHPRVSLAADIYGASVYASAKTVVFPPAHPSHMLSTDCLGAGSVLQPPA